MAKPERTEQIYPLKEELIHYLRAVTEINFTRRIFPAVSDAQRIDAYLRAITNTVEALKKPRPLHVASGCGLLPMVAHRAGAFDIVACEPRRYAAKLAKDVIKLNQLEHHIRVVNKAPTELKLDQDLVEQPNMLVLENIDNSLLGCGLLETIAYAKKHLLTKDAVILPKKAIVHAMGIELRTDRVAGFDLSRFNRFRGAPIWETAALEEEPYKPLTDIVDVFEFDLQQGTFRSQKKSVDFKATRDGVLTTVAFWFTLYLEDDLWVTSAPHHAGNKTWKQCIIQLPETPVKQHETITLVAEHDTTRFDFSFADRANPRPLVSVPRWQFAMLADEERNSAFMQSLRYTVNGDSVVLDIGAGSGLLSMMAAREGAKKVYAVEMIKHLADTAREIIKDNKLDSRIEIIEKQSTQIKPNEDFTEKPSVLISETFDYGLLGEGFGRSFNHAQALLLSEHPHVIPQSATVYAMGVELRTDKVKEFDLGPLDALRIRPDYEGILLRDVEHKQITDVFKVYHFDFTKKQISAEHKEFDVNVINEGLLNAVVYWFTLHLDDQISIAGGPSNTAIHWKQALRYLYRQYHLERDTKVTFVSHHNLSEIYFEVHRWKADQLKKHKLFEPEWEYPSKEDQQLFQENAEKITKAIQSETVTPEQLRELFGHLLEEAGRLDIDTELTLQTLRTVANSLLHPWSRVIKLPTPPAAQGNAPSGTTDMPPTPPTPQNI